MMEFFCKKKLFRKDISTKIFDQVQNKPLYVSKNTGDQKITKFNTQKGNSVVINPF